MYNKCEKLLKAKGMTFADLSRATGIGENVFSNLKTRGGHLSLDNAVKVAKVLKVKVEDLIA